MRACVDRTLNLFWSISLVTFIWGEKNRDDSSIHAIGLGDKLFLRAGCPVLWTVLLGRVRAGVQSPRSETAPRRFRSPFLWPLPSRCARAGLGSWVGAHYTEHSCDLPRLVNIPTPVPLNFANPLGLFAGAQPAASGRRPLGGVFTAGLSGKLGEPTSSRGPTRSAFREVPAVLVPVRPFIRTKEDAHGVSCTPGVTLGHHK